MPSIKSCSGDGVYIPPETDCNDCSAVRDQLNGVLSELDAVESELDNKVDKVSGKNLSTNDYTNADKNKLAGIEAGAGKNRTYTAFTGKPNGNQLPGFGESFVVQQIKQNTAGQVSATDHYVSIPSDIATASKPGLMSASDKSKLDGIASGAETNRTYNPVTGKPTSNQTPDFGGTVTISQVSQNAAGQVAVTDKKIKIPDSTATSLKSGLMSATDKGKLDGIDNGAQKNRTYNAVTGKPVSNLTPGFGDTVTISQISQNTEGQISAVDHTIKIPNNTATTSKSGLMSATDKTNLESLLERVTALEKLLGNKKDTVLSMVDANNNETSVTVLAE